MVGSVRQQNVPTSGGVHLYPDPQTFPSDNPILYADCEGLEGGEREPMAERIKKASRHTGNHIPGRRTQSLETRDHCSEREITWADTPTKRSREFAVMSLYPRLLYTFSDVVVFVLKNPR